MIKLIELTKVCTKCGERKSFKIFNKSSKGCLGIDSSCKICKNKYNKIQGKIYRKLNHNKIMVSQKAYRKINKDKLKKAKKQSDKTYYEANKDKIQAYRKTYKKLNKEKIKIKGKIYYQINKDRMAAQAKKYRKANPEIIKTQDKKCKNKRKLKPGFKLNNNIANLIRRSLKNGNGKNGHHWETLVPYDLNDLIKRLKKTLPKGYTWNDYINGKTDLQIDHIIPISKHNFKSYTDTDFHRCWALKNLQLLPAIKNISKGAKLTKPFQPSLLL